MESNSSRLKSEIIKESKLLNSMNTSELTIARRAKTHSSTDLRQEPVFEFNLPGPKRPRGPGMQPGDQSSPPAGIALAVRRSESPGPARAPAPSILQIRVIRAARAAASRRRAARITIFNFAYLL
jgi:hypothetical protein